MMSVIVDVKDKMNLGVANGVFPGATYAIIYKNNIIMDAVGNKSLYPVKEINCINTVYDTASLTKVIVTNFLIGKLIEENQINLKDAVQKYLPEIKHNDITIEDLLLHASGLPANVSWWHINKKEEYLNLILNINKQTKRKTKAIYSDIGFIMLGVIIEKITNKQLDQLAQEMIFDVLNMKNTSFNPKNTESCAPTELENNTYIKGIVHDKKARLFNGVSGHAGMFSTISDITNFAQMILNDGFYNNKKIISKDILETWYKPRIKDDKDRYRTIGWIEGKNSGLCDSISSKSIYHQGFTGSRFLIDKKSDLAIIVLSNRIHPTRDNDKFGPFWAEFVQLVYNNIKNSGKEKYEKFN